MAGWFPMDLDLQDKPKFLAVRAALQIDPDTLVGKLWKFWGWFDEQSEDGFLPFVTAEVIDERIGVVGFAAAMVRVKWLLIDEGGASMPNFDERHTNSSKKRLANARRQKNFKARSASKQDGNAPASPQRYPSVTEALPTSQDITSQSTTSLGSSAAEKQKAAAAAKAFVKALPEQWKPGVEAVRSLNAKRGNWAIQVAVESGYTPLRVVEVVEFGKRNAKAFKSLPGAIVDRLTTVGPEVPAPDGWAAEIPREAAKPRMDPEVARALAINRMVSQRGISRAEAMAIVDEQLALTP